MEDLENLLKAKIPCDKTGIRIHKTMCDICSPGFHCGIDAYVKDGRVIKIEGTTEHPVNKGKLCTKGAASRQYIYREDRIKTPLKRIGKKGEGNFQKISWKEAYNLISEKLLKIKEECGANAVTFYSGYPKWFRPMLHRLAYSFGTVNYCTESSSCHSATEMAWKASAGTIMSMDCMNSKTFLGWSFNPSYSSLNGITLLEKLKKQGTKIIIIDPKITHVTENYADLHLQIKAGTDGALALGMAKIIIENGWENKEFINKYTVGYKEYAEYVSKWNIDKVSQITGLRKEDILKVAKWYATNGPSSISESSATITHHINGFQNYRAIVALAALTGNLDCKGGNIPHLLMENQSIFFHKRNFYMQKYIKSNEPKIGALRFPLWSELIDEGQAMDLTRQIKEKKPYPIKALMAFGMNARMFPSTEKLLEALKELDFFVDVDLFMTQTSKYADIILPACTSFERENFKVYPSGFAFYTKPVIKTLYDSKDDAQIICDLAKKLNLNDDLLKSGMKSCVESIIKPMGLSIDELKKNELPIKISNLKYLEVGNTLKNGFKTPSGKFEFKSSIIEKIDKKYNLDSIPTYSSPLKDLEQYKKSFILITGVRIPNALHSRLHDVPWLRSFRENPLIDINEGDAKLLGIKQNDKIRISNDFGTIIARANLTCRIQRGTIQMYHGYEEANVNLLVSNEHLDPYSGFPGYKTNYCSVEKI